MLNKIYHGDCSVVLSEFPEGSVDLVVTSPPYDLLRDYGGHQFRMIDIIEALQRVLRPGGVVIWIVGDSVVKGSETGSSFRQAIAFMSRDFLLHDTMIFEKNTSSFPARKKSNRYTQIFEYMFVFSLGRPPKTANLLCDKENKWAGWTNWGTQTKRKRSGELVEVPDLKPVPKSSPRNNIWRYTVSGGFGQKDRAAYKHPATFPQQLAEDHILTWSNEGDVVLDPMCGSGTTCVAAKKLKRSYVGIDIEKAYYELSKKRVGHAGK